MVTIASRIVAKLRTKYPTAIRELDLLDELPTGKLFAELRMAALLHDIGHGFLSHVSEGIYKWHPDFRELKKEERFSHAKASEIFTYLIITSDPFRKLFETYVLPAVPKVELDSIANLVMGKARPEEFFVAQIINGALDADKVDYISRDAFYSGISTTIDIDRLFNDLILHRYPSGLNSLVLSGPIPLERILFSKILLYTTIYYHQKVKAADCMVEGLLEYVNETGNTLYGYEFKDPTDFLRITDNEFFSRRAPSKSDSYIQSVVDNLTSRRLLQRCLVLSRETLEDYESQVYFLNRLSKAPPNLVRELRQKIMDEVGKKVSCSIHDIWVSLPEQPSLREASQTLALQPGESQPVKINDIFPLDGWLRAFSNNKWRGYVFAPENARSAVYEAAKKVLEDYGIRLNAKSSAYAHISVEAE